jgi:hypothetical protein
MNKLKNTKINFALVTIIVALLFFSNQIHNRLHKPLIKISKEQSSFTLNKTFLNVFSLGHRRLISTYLWIYTLLESDNEHYKQRDGNSWMFLRHNTIAELDPKFYENYLFGGIYLSIIKDDVYGAAEIYEKGLKYYSKDYMLLLNTAFNYYFEMKDTQRGYEKFLILKDHPELLEKNPGLLSLIARIGNSFGDTKDAFDLLLVLYKNSTNKQVKLRYANSLYALKAEMDLDCLNQNKMSCARQDFFGNDYIRVNGVYSAKLKWKKFVPFKKKSKLEK